MYIRKDLDMSTKTNALQAQKKKVMLSYIDKMAPAIKMALPSVITPERFTRMVLTAMSSTPELCNCTPESFLAAMMQAAQLGVEPNTPLGQAYILPYRNKGTMEAQFQLGYKGMIDLAYRSEEVTIIQAHVVHENDKFEYAYGLEPVLVHVPAAKNRGEATHVYAVYKTKSGGSGFEVMSMEDARMHGQRYSRSFGSNYSPWQSNFEEMAKKTVLKKVLKYAPLKSDFKRDLVADETIKTEIAQDMSFVHDETVYETTAAVVEEAPAPPQEAPADLDAEMDEIFGA